MNVSFIPEMSLSTWSCVLPQKLQRSLIWSFLANVGSLRLVSLVEDFIDEAVFEGLFCRHEVVALGVLGDDFDRLAGVLGEDAVQAFSRAQDVLGNDLDLGRLSSGAAGVCIMQIASLTAQGMNPGANNNYDSAQAAAESAKFADVLKGPTRYFV